MIVDWESMIEEGVIWVYEGTRKGPIWVFLDEYERVQRGIT